MAKIIFLYIILVAFLDASPCSSKYNCIVVPDKETPELINLNCTLPNLPKLTINAVDVLDADGDLKHYWARHTVCDVLGWMEKAVAYVEPNYVGIDPQTISNDVELRIGHMKPVICC